MNERGGSCFPSVDCLVEETGLTKRSVCTHLEMAEREGWVRRRVHGFKGRGWKRHEYEPAIPPHAREGGERDSPPPMTYERSEAGSPRTVVKEVHHHEKVVNVMHEGGEGGSPKEFKRGSSNIPDRKSVV